LDELRDAVMAGDADRTVRLTQDAIEGAAPPEEILNGMVAAMDEVGRQFQCGNAFVPEMLFASRAMRSGLALLEPILVEEGIKPEVTAVIGTVQGDLHDLGKDLVIMMWKGANFEVIDLGIDVPADRFIKAIKKYKAQIVGLSTLLTTTMSAMEATVHAIKQAKPKGVKTIVGGAPVSQEFADVIGADAYGPDAVAAVDIARKLVSG
jgi:5-methyltetrahydrofolate--homocysteine methyltransferase